eukprot:CAMPEP_0201510634 /NCGR_PEP_ID=MMETSP0161_2-20130828/3238_1 /ASSEMBLY_ACC=CAM_ASM_000251 /TAXON_ID=180227 /ORGANISM="Neoparamoeba aestuarina, Strain SoJaBio B1-5/56/2" /LENGTH=454 /DNA_ID=CAMNT_0047905831 /DNA_START=73 /DNA_END=1434 /DNA_ORIENTATION=-
MADDHPPPYLYLPPGKQSFVPFSAEAPPPIPEGATRVVSIADTHNEHEAVSLPWGHLLIHAGDILTESGQRYCKRDEHKNVISVDEKGPKLFRKFAKWLGKQPHPHKVIIGGNHDLVIQNLTPEVVRSILDEFSPSPKTAIYLEHEEATVGGIVIFGSPFAHWGGRNDAYMSVESPFSPSPLSDPTHIVITHSPCILPKHSGIRENSDVIGAMNDAGTKLCVGGHCHWAHGLYFSENGNIPTIVASVCDSKWLRYKELKKGPSGKRGDTRDRTYGGYNLRFPIIVTDLMIPGGPPSKDDTFQIGLLSDPLRDSLSSLTRSGNDIPSPHHPSSLPALLFFGPETDPGAVVRLVPKFSENFVVFHFDDVEEAVEEVEKGDVMWVACVAKLGSKGNLGRDVMKAMRKKYSNAFIVLHSSTAGRKEETRKRVSEYVGGIDLFVAHSNEDVMLDALKEL